MNGSVLWGRPYLLLALRWLRCFVAALGKLADLDASRRAVEQFGVPARAAGTLGVVLPLVELGLAVALIPVATASVLRLKCIP